MTFRFLTAEWRHLGLLTYAVPDSLLEGLLPSGFTLDRYDGKACVSFVAFDFQNTKVLGIPWPGFRNFPEINLRFYVKGNGRRGVMFVKELVHNPFVAWVARVSYNEPYEALPMQSSVNSIDYELRVVHHVTRENRTHRLNLVCRNKPYLPSEDSAEHFFKEHQWGFGINRRGQTLQYEVQHPHWRVFPVDSYDGDIDFAQLYGPKWELLNKAQPLSVICAEGSGISVMSPRGI